MADVLLILSDIVVAIAEYSLDVDPTHNTFENGLTWLFVLQILRNVKLIRALRLIQIYKHIRAANSHKWGLYSVRAQRTKRGIEIVWSNVALEAGVSSEVDTTLIAGEDASHVNRAAKKMEGEQKIRKNYGPLIIGIDPESPDEPVTVHERYEHINVLKRQSNFCFKVPAHSPDSPPTFAGFLQFDPMKKDVRCDYVLDL